MTEGYYDGFRALQSSIRFFSFSHVEDGELAGVVWSVAVGGLIDFRGPPPPDMSLDLAIDMARRGQLVVRIDTGQLAVDRW